MKSALPKGGNLSSSDRVAVVAIVAIVAIAAISKITDARVFLALIALVLGVRWGPNAIKAIMRFWR